MLLGLTGGIATGKSTFGRILADKYPFVTFDADAYVHELLAKNPDVIEAIRTNFGNSAFTPTGHIDRAALRTIVFQNSLQRQALEKILHPRVRERLHTIRTNCIQNGHALLVDIPLLFETGAETAFDATVLVAASQSTQESRIAARGHNKTTTHAMLASQWPMSKKIKAASYVVWNDGTKAALTYQAALLLAAISLATTNSK